MVLFGGTSEQSMKVFFLKISPIHKSFLPHKFPAIRYLKAASIYLRIAFCVYVDTNELASYYIPTAKAVVIVNLCVTL